MGSNFPLIKTFSQWLVSCHVCIIHMLYGDSMRLPVTARSVVCPIIFFLDINYNITWISWTRKRGSFLFPYIYFYNCWTVSSHLG